MSAQTIYAALSGAEIRKIMKDKICQHIDKIPLLSAGNTFHRAAVQFGFVMKAHPADVPTPPASEFEFELMDEALDPQFWLSHRMGIKELKAVIESLESKKEQVENYISKAYLALDKIEPEVESIHNINENPVPDQVRLENNLPIPVVQTNSSGVKNENFVEAKSLFPQKAAGAN